MGYPLKISKEGRKIHVNLLMTEDKSSIHFSTIINFHGLIKKQYSRNRCRCLQGFTLKKGEKTREECSRLQDHLTYCKKQDAQKITYPTVKEKIEFKNVRKMIKADEVLNADFECLLLENEDGTNDTSCSIRDEPKKKRKRQRIFQDHQAISWFTRLSSTDENFSLENEAGFEFPHKNRMWERMLLRNFLTT